MRLGIGGRLLIAHLFLSVVVLAVVELTLSPFLHKELDRQLEARLHTAARALASELADGVVPHEATRQVARATNFRLSVIGPDGSLIGDSALPASQLPAAGPHGQRQEVLEARNRRYGSEVRESATTGVPTRYVAVPASGDRVARAAADLRDFNASMDAADRALTVALVIGLLLALAIGAFITWIASRSVQQLTAAARRMAEGDLRDLHVPRGPGELADVAVALERLASRLAEQIGRLTTERDLLDAVLAAMEEAVMVLRPDGRLLLANGAASHFLSLPRSAQDQRLIEVVRFPALLDGVEQASHGKVAPLDFILPGPPRRELFGRATPLPRGSEAAVVVVLRDLTELRRLESIRRDFVASASHELRTPVAAIRGYAETLAAGVKDEATAARFLAGLSRQAERLSNLIDDLLDLSRIESGGMRLVPQSSTAAAVLARQADFARDRAERQGIDLQLETAAADLTVFADPRAIDMAVGNLVENAIKYTPPGGRVILSARRENGSTLFVVRDTGPGIQAEHLARIFERFYRIDAGRAREAGGTGLGLAIAKHIAQQSGGDVGVESKPGVGSTFWVRLPARSRTDG